MDVDSYVKWKSAILVKFNESFSFVLTQKKQKVKEEFWSAAFIYLPIFFKIL
jgi:hypothetical protein